MTLSLLLILLAHDYIHQWALFLFHILHADLRVPERIGLKTIIHLLREQGLLVIVVCHRRWDFHLA